MIVYELESFNPLLLFIQIPRTGSTSVAMEIKKKINREKYGIWYPPLEGLNEKFHIHQRISAYEQFQRPIEGALKIITVRNPYDRVLSHFNIGWYGKSVIGTYHSFSKWLKIWCSLKESPHKWECGFTMSDYADRPFDIMLKYENRKKIISSISKNLMESGIITSPLDVNFIPKDNVSKKREIKLNEGHIKIINERFKCDFKKFKYEKL